MTEEHEAVVHMRDMGLLHIQCELQLAFKELSARLAYCFSVPSSSFDNDHKIIRVTLPGTPLKVSDSRPSKATQPSLPRQPSS